MLQPGDRVQCHSGPLYGEMGIVEKVSARQVWFWNMDDRLLCAERRWTER